MSFPAIEDQIPHRRPFLFLDEIVELETTWVRARCHVSTDADYLRGHYPGYPMLPGVLMVEMSLQAGAYLMAVRGPPAQPGQVPVVVRLETVKFKRPVRPPAEVFVRVEMTDRVGPAQLMAARLEVEGKAVATLGFTVTVAPADGAGP